MHKIQRMFTIVRMSQFPAPERTEGNYRFRVLAIARIMNEDGFWRQVATAYLFRDRELINKLYLCDKNYPIS